MISKTLQQRVLKSGEVGLSGSFFRKPLKFGFHTADIPGSGKGLLPIGAAMRAPVKLIPGMLLAVHFL